jgi:transposase
MQSQVSSQRSKTWMNLQGPHAEAFRQLTAGLTPEQILVVPLDIGKNVHWAAFHTRDGRLLTEPLQLSALQEGLARFTTTLDTLIAQHQPRLVILGHEPTGIYHQNWAYQLLQRYQPHLDGTATPRFRYVFLNPHQVKLNRLQTWCSFSKSDLIDLGAIGDLLARGLGQPAHLPTSTALLIHEQVRALRTLQQEQARHTRRLLATLDQLWPNAFLNPERFARTHPDLTVPPPLVTRPLERQVVQALITLCPNPHEALRLGPQGLIRLFHQHHFRCGPKTAAKLLDAARRAVLPPPDLAAALTDVAQRDYARFQRLQQDEEATLQALETALPLTPARHLLAIPGTSVRLVARYVAGVGEPQAYLCADQIWAKAGFDPLITASGDALVSGPISRQGDPFLRDTLYLLGYQLALHCGYFSHTFLSAIAAGKSSVEATIHTAHQVNRVFFHLLQHDEPFAPLTLPNYPAFAQTWQTKMRAYLKSPRRRGAPKRRRPRQTKCT